jgi:glycosyltransferase involved in cell wall biosynthesis
VVVQDDNVRFFAEALYDLLTDAKLRRRLGNAARSAVEQHHRPEEVGAQLEAVVLEALDAPRSLHKNK